MKVRFEEAVMDRPDLYGRDLNAMVDAFAKNRHQWSIDDPDRIRGSRWIQEGPRYDRLAIEIAEKAWRAAIDEVSPGPSGRLLIVAVEDQCPIELWRDEAEFYASPAHARKILEQPVYVVLENSEADWNFLKAMARAFEALAVLQAIGEHWLMPFHAGGAGEFKKRIQELLARGVVGWRIVAFLDSDRLAPGPLPQSTQKKVQGMESAGVKTIVLFKREIENYLPDAAIDDRKHHEAYVSLLSLTRQQRDYFDMKQGFEQDKVTGKPMIPPEQQALFAGANPWHLKRLVGGFGKKIGDRFANPALLRDEMNDVCETCPGEMEHILRTLEELL